MIVFEPMPIIGKHHVDPSIRTPRSQRRVAGNSQGEDKATVVLIDMYRTPVSGVLRRKDSGFAVCGENPAGVSRFAAKTGPAFHSLWRESDAADPSSTKMKSRSFKHEDEEETPSSGLVSSGRTRRSTPNSARVRGEHRARFRPERKLRGQRKSERDEEHRAGGDETQLGRIPRGVGLRLSSGGSSRKSVIAAKPKQLSRRHPIVE